MDGLLVEKFLKFWNNWVLSRLAGLWVVFCLLYFFYFHDSFMEWVTNLPWVFPDLLFESIQSWLVFALFPWSIFWFKGHTIMVLWEVDKR